MQILFFNLGGYTVRDPLDKAPKRARFFLLISINLVLTILLLLLINNRIVQFNGFDLWGIRFPAIATIGLEVIMNAVSYSLLIILLRKASSVYLFLLVFLPYFLMDLFIEHHYRQAGHPELALWNYTPGTIIAGIDPPALRFLITLSVDGFLFGVVGIYLARLLAAVWYRNKEYPLQPTEQQYKNLFRDEWSAETVEKPKRGLIFWALRLLGLGYFAYLGILLVGLLGAGPWPKGMADLIELTYLNPALAINTYFKIGLMITLTFLAAYNRKLRFHACLGLLVGHLVSTIYALAFYFIDSLQASNRPFLLLSGEVDGGLIILFVLVMLTHRKDSRDFAPEKDFPADFSTPLSLQTILYKLLFVVFLCITVAIVLFRVFGNGKTGFSAVFGYPDPMVGNTVTLYSTLTLYYFLLIGRRKLRHYFFNPLVVPLLFGSLIAMLWILIGDSNGDVRIARRDGGWVEADWYFVLFALFNLLVSFGLMAARRAVFQIDYAVNTLQPAGAMAAMAIASSLLDADDKQQAATLKEIDGYAGGIRGRRRGLLNLPFSLFENVLNFIYGFRPPFSTMSREEQRWFAQRYLFRSEIERRNAMLPYLANFAYNIGTSLNTITSFAFYATPNARASINYVPVDARDRVQGDEAAFAPPHKGVAPLPFDHNDPRNFRKTSVQKVVAPRVTTPVGEPAIPTEVDYLIIGSGAAGGTMAYRLACQVADPGRVMVIERGQRYQPLQDFSDNEMEMIRKIYKEGGLQQTKRFTMTVLQGECVGGTTVSNNAVCFKMPDRVRSKWEQEFDLCFADLDQAYKKIEEELSIQPLKAGGVNEKVKAVFEDAVNGFNRTVSPEMRLTMEGIVPVNHLTTLGDGNWNLGNKRMLKRSMLETYLPWAEARGVRIIPNMTAVRFTTSGSHRKASSVMLRTDNGELMTVNIKKALIVAGGAIASSSFLLRSEVTGAVGRGMSCNFAFPFAFDFEEEKKAYDGDQITMAATDPLNRAVFETYFNPPASFSLASMPFFFNRRQELMSRYAHLVNFGTLIGSEPNGKIRRKPDPLSGRAFDWAFGEKDRENIRYATETLLWLGRHAGATRVFLPTKPGLELLLTDKNIASLTESVRAYPLRMEDLFTGTAHPQGGNRMAGKEYKNGRVINEEFRVDGFDNVYVTDASVFPSSLTVNPQWTIMALSSMASKTIIAAHE